MQVPALQKPPVAQALSSLQAVWQAPDLQAKPLQLTGKPGTQRPEPSHAAPEITEVLVGSQVETVAQTVPAGSIAQAPLPSQEPTLPHVAGSCIGQSTRGSAPP